MNHDIDEKIKVLREEVDAALKALNSYPPPPRKFEDGASVFAVIQAHEDGYNQVSRAFREKADELAELLKLKNGNT